MLLADDDDDLLVRTRTHTHTIISSIRLPLCGGSSLLISPRVATGAIDLYGQTGITDAHAFDCDQVAI